MYQVPYHTVDLSKYRFLVTGGAGFIGSNIVEYLLKFNAGHVRVLDNLSNGYFDNIKDFISLSNFEFVQGDIRDIDVCKNAVCDIDFVTHQAALGSVPRSIADPVTTNEVNISGFLNVLTVVKDAANVKRMIYAASSSTYGNSSKLPKIEGEEGQPLSPYAVTKAVNEMYGEVFSKVYGLHTIGLRYFNVFGPKQNPDNPYAAVIPIFCKAFINNTTPTINGDGENSRDFTFVENAVQANIKSLFSEKLIKHEVFNVACGDQVSLNDMLALLKGISGNNIKINYGPERDGDVKHSKASIERIQLKLGYNPQVKFKEGLEMVFQYYKNSKS